MGAGSVWSTELLVTLGRFFTSLYSHFLIYTVRIIIDRTSWCCFED